jgi:hypothetical protein
MADLLADSSRGIAAFPDNYIHPGQDVAGIISGWRYVIIYVLAQIETSLIGSLTVHHAS